MTEKASDQDQRTVMNDGEVRSILERARGIEAQAATIIARRLADSVVRPLREALPSWPESDVNSATLTGEGLADELWSLARDTTTLYVNGAAPLRVAEAAAALQDLAYKVAAVDDASRAIGRLAELKELQAALQSGIQLESNGPYLVTNAEHLRNWLGEDIPVRPLMALCRCGQSAIKPLCDGTHAESGFTDQKDPKRVPDQRDTYVGQQITILDNRGTCAHSGFCTEHLASVFRLGKEPFVAPSGARLDDIIRTIRACPSGALSFAIGGREAREQVDQDRPPIIEVSKDGPYRVTGAVPLKNSRGDSARFNEGASSEHYSLCRCGHSQNKPFCSGMHWYVKFADPKPDADREPTVFEWAGGLPALTRLTRLFYEKYVPDDPLIGPLFANMAPDHPERVAAWLGEVFGGPKNYSHNYGGYPRMVSQHIGKGLTEAQRARWVSLICRSADDAGLPADPEFRAAFVAYLEWGSRLALENSQPDAKPPMHMPMPRWWWACEATPGARISASTPAQQIREPLAFPGPNEPVTFTQHIKPLFRKMDRESMTFAFDLWSHRDVSTHGPTILKRLESGTMPCDGAWQKEKVDLFRRWIESGMVEG